MGKDRVQRHVESLEKVIQNNYFYLKEAIDDFQTLCRLITPEKRVPGEIVIHIRKMYREIQDRLTEIKAIQQILQGRYRQYYRRNLLRDRELAEFGSVAKYCYSKFEYTLRQMEALKKIKGEGTFPKGDRQRKSFQWFISKENQVAFIKNLRVLMDLDYEPPPQGIGERREISGERSLLLFLFRGDSNSLDKLQSEIPLREHDLIERSGREELRGVMTHLREVTSSSMEERFRNFIQTRGFMKLKCILLPVYSMEDLERDILHLIGRTLEEMREGEVKTISI
jgi:hypothetical protein